MSGSNDSVIREDCIPTSWRRYNKEYGVCINAECCRAIDKVIEPNLKGEIQLIFTSPPFPLNRAKKYGNLSGDEYKTWICNIGKKLTPLLRKDGSIVIEMGNAWNAGEPTFSTLPIETLLQLKKECNLFLCQEFIYYNPARLPGPIEWVNKRRIRVKDAFSRVWWMSTTETPYANNAEVLEPYSRQMKKLMESGKYNWGSRPSEHVIGEETFLNNNGGSIPSNVIIAPNTDSNTKYIKQCKERNITIHPARMPIQVPEFFIKMLTRENDIVLDCFAGSNTTGYVAENLHRRWISTEINSEYYRGSKYRF